jgi:hypothetical protein
MGKADLAGSVALPDAAGTATFDAATCELTIPDMPAHATFLRAIRKPAGGTAESAGVSNTATVTVVGVTPPTPGVVLGTPKAVVLPV